MGTPKPTLVCHAVATAAAELDSDPSSAIAWSAARRALEGSGEEQPDLAAAIAARDHAALRSIVEGWTSGKRLLPEHDRTILKHALKAFRKSLKLTRLDAESKIGGGPLSKGQGSGIVGISPPPHYPREVWDELVRQKRLLRDRHGMYELPPE